jgi:hypothetical protein
MLQPFTAPPESAQTTDLEIGCSCSVTVIQSFAINPLLWFDL